MAYDLGDRYRKDTVRCGTVSELRILSHNMYEDFIRRDRKGFSSSSHFSDIFRRLTGMLPQAYQQERMRI